MDFIVYILPPPSSEPRQLGPTHGDRERNRIPEYLKYRALNILFKGPQCLKEQTF